MSGCGDVCRPVKNCNECKTKINLTRKDQKQRNVFYADFIFIILRLLGLPANLVASIVTVQLSDTHRSTNMLLLYRILIGESYAKGS